ncbi:MAG: Asp-tRNA(Asn)/Glu-tRNA(Gln) amidotransferase subunit GatB [Oscillospiraceae bacterium]|nr:Asp-tRNA(Asn)/Glu-tRNA(Gln) amidotransferase subunit GatB [Oscillospiraceae bacterium]
MSWEKVIGLETHVELSTTTKIFCSCTTQFGGDPNTHCCPVCTGQPGSLPILNKRVVEYAVKAGLALNCDINLISKMDRKHYVYPDLPKAYQISQYDVPLCEHGWVELDSGRIIRITRIHIEEDAGKLIHENGKVYIDYNRGGVPLIEIVTEPDFRSGEEAAEYLEKLQGIMRTVGISDCHMQEGSMRCDVNISLRPMGSETYGTRTEIKNLNSFSSVITAINYEYERQSSLLECGERVVQETLHFNADTGETANMRGKENADDYRYFPEPDIVPIVLEKEFVDGLKADMPEMPSAKLKRYVSELNVAEADAKLIVKYGAVSAYFEKAAAQCEARQAASFMVTQMYSRISTESEREHWSPTVSADELAELVKLLTDGKISRNIAKRTFEKMLDEGKPCTAFLTEEDMSGVDDNALRELCAKAVAANEKSASDYKAGKEKALKAILGFVMKESKGRANAVEAEKLLKEMLS